MSGTSKSTKIWPVIHLVSTEKALHNAGIAARCGCEGVFVIHHDGDAGEVDRMGAEVMREFPALKVGVNYLGLPADKALAKSLALGAQATWVDKGGVTSAGVESIARDVAGRLKDVPEHLFFCSVAFKYQPVERDPAAAALAAAQLGMIPTTSGVGTGVAPEASKLHAMRAALGSHPLAVASGITPDNVYELGRFITHILVATGVSRDFHTLDEQLLMKLVAGASEY